MNKKSIPELDKLFQEIGTYKETTEFKKLLDFIKKFPRIAPYNAMLLHIQKPGSNYVTSASDWLNRFGRMIKPGARPMVILRPFGPVPFVFDLSDTEGKPFPEELLNPFGVEGKISNFEFEMLIRNLNCDGIRFSIADYGTNMAGQIGTSASGKEVKIQKTTKEVWVKVLYDMVVNKNHKPEVQFATILHELGHLYCGHLGIPNFGDRLKFKWWEDRRGLGLNEREFEAECVCWLVCERKGINNPSAAYLNGYLENNEHIPEISTDTILKAVAIIESMIKEEKDPRKEIISRVVELKNN